ncbi:aminotransferase-like domain-containing protein [Oryzibacter oryziterrae]|uniref:aminotransferase-like domain-containing protein n=1 Tax=Oryzibacter oryziterrae TaxID=2766474 RepID=UPI001F2BA9E8|nr:PLP-dependent aminotransferase family protein [Oryzibacter oryziterrae]
MRDKVSTPQEKTLVERVGDSIRDRISSRSLTPGARLPSIRALADRLGISKSTVVEAYDRLVAEGVITARPGSGFYVAGHMPPLSLADIGPKLDRAVDPLWVSRQSLDSREESLKPGCGWLPASWTPETEIRKAMRALSRDTSLNLSDYDQPLGLPPLRQSIARRMVERGVTVSPDQVILTDSGSQAIDLVCRFLLEPGDTVLVDDPCYFNFLATLKAHRVRVVSTPFTPTGPDLVAFERNLIENRPRLYLTNSVFHNPTGASIAPHVAHRMLKLAAEHELLIVEDEIFASFETTPTPRLATFDGFDRVIQVGGFSKTITPAVRTGYVIVKESWIEPLIDLKVTTSFGNSRVGAALVYAILTDNAWRRHVESMKARLAEATGETVRRLAALGVVPWIEPRGGIFLWTRLPGGIDAAEVARVGLAQRVVFAPGNVFSLAKDCSSFMRFNVAQCTDPRIFDVLGRALEEVGRAA